MKHLKFEGYKELIFELIALQFFSAWNWLKKHKDETPADVFRNRIDLCRKTDPNAAEMDIADIDFRRKNWREIEKKLCSIYKMHKNDTSAESFENEAMKASESILNKFIEITYGKSEKFKSYQCGSLKFDPPREDKKNTVIIHIANACAPKSIFYESGYLEKCFIDLCNKVEKEYGVKYIETNTWLNSVPKWLKYFPEEWNINMSEEFKNIEWHFGFWGQFISASGTFNHKYGRILRKSGNFPFYPRKSFCSLENLRQCNLKKLSKIKSD